MYKPMFPYPENFVVEFEDGSKVNVASKECFVHCGTKAETIARQAIQKAGKKVPYKDRTCLFPVKIYKLEIDDGQLVAAHFQTFQTTYSHEDMTKEEFDKEMVDILENIPSPFRGFISSEAWDRGHSNGYQEVIGIADEMANKLLPYIQDYKEYLEDESD